jgi:uncharacterized phage-associated protein
MRFIFDERKAAQAAAFLLSRHEGHLNYMKLIKLLYLADRRALIARGLPITGDRMVSMPKGPVLSGILDLINWGSIDEQSPWLEYISVPSEYEISLLNPDIDYKALSRYEKRLLTETDERFGDYDKWSLVRYTHTLPEWTDPKGSSLPIDPADILRLENRSEKEIAEFKEEAEEALFLNFLVMRAA